jgi:hypothetical protein
LAHAPDLNERHLAGVLPKNELLSRVKDVLFAPFADCEEFKDACPECGCDDGDDVSVTTAPAAELGASAYETLKKIKAIAASRTLPVTIKAWGNTITCANCRERSPFYRRSAVVSIDWHGHDLAREYAL